MEPCIPIQRIRRCCVPGCYDFTSTRHRFPISEPDVFNVWVNRIQNPKFEFLQPESIYKSYYVCGRHFSVECKVRGSKKLVRRVVPTLHVPGFTEGLPEIIPMPIAGNNTKTTSLSDQKDEPQGMETQFTISNSPCAVAGCDTFQREEKYHSFWFPKDKEKCKEWCIAIGKEELLEEPPTILHYRVCSRHFSLELFTSGHLNRLYPHAVPNQKIPTQPNSDREGIKVNTSNEIEEKINNIVKKDLVMYNIQKNRVITGRVKGKSMDTRDTVVNRVLKRKNNVKCSVVTNTLSRRMNELNQQTKLNLNQPFKIKTQNAGSGIDTSSCKQDSTKSTQQNKAKKILKPPLKQGVKYRLLKKINVSQFTVKKGAQGVVVKKIVQPGSLKPTAKVVRINTSQLLPINSSVQSSESQTPIPVETGEQDVKYRVIRIPHTKEDEVLKSWQQSTKQGVVKDCLLENVLRSEEIVINSGKENENSDTQDIVMQITEKTDLQKNLVLNKVPELGIIKDKQVMINGVQYNVVNTDLKIINKPNFGVGQNGALPRPKTNTQVINKTNFGVEQNATPPRVVKTNTQVINKPYLSVPNILKTTTQINKKKEQNGALNIVNTDIKINKPNFGVENGTQLTKVKTPQHKSSPIILLKGKTGNKQLTGAQYGMNTDTQNSNISQFCIQNNEHGLPKQVINTVKEYDKKNPQYLVKKTGDQQIFIKVLNEKTGYDQSNVQYGVLKSDNQFNKPQFSVEQNGALHSVGKTQQNPVIFQNINTNLQNLLYDSHKNVKTNTQFGVNNAPCDVINTQYGLEKNTPQNVICCIQNDSVNFEIQQNPIKTHEDVIKTVPQLFISNKVGLKNSQHSPKLKTDAVNIAQDLITFVRPNAVKTGVKQNVKQTGNKGSVQKNKVNNVKLLQVLKNVNVDRNGVKNSAINSSSRYCVVKNPAEQSVVLNNSLFDTNDVKTTAQVGVVVNSHQYGVPKNGLGKTLVPRGSVMSTQQNKMSQENICSGSPEEIVINGTQQGTVKLKVPSMSAKQGGQSVVNNGTPQIFGMRLLNHEFKPMQNPVFLVNDKGCIGPATVKKNSLPITKSSVSVQTSPRITNWPTVEKVQRVKKEIKKIKRHLRIDISTEEEDLCNLKTLSTKYFPAEFSLLGNLHLERRGKTFKGLKYASEFIETLLKIYFTNQNWYRFNRQSLHFPTIKELKNKIHEEYVNKSDEELSNLIGIKTKNFKKTAKDCVLCIDKIKIKPHLFYNIKKDEIIGLEHCESGKGDEPAQYVLIFMLRGIHHNWTQLLGYMFISSNHQFDLKNVIFNYIITLQNYNLTIKAIVTSTETIFYNLAKELTISPEKPYFELNEQVIFYIFDAPNLLVTLRDVFFNNTFKYKGCIIDKNYIKQIQSFKRSSKLNLKMRNKDFKNAAQLFSNKTADFMNCFISCGVLPIESQTTVEFIRNINNLFDILNSSSEEGYKFKKPLNEQYQIDYLNDMMEMFDKIETNNFDVKNIFWCWQITIVSTFQLFHGSEIKNLQTRRLNLLPLQLFDKRKLTPVRFRVKFRKEFVKNLFCTEGTKIGRVNDLLKHLELLYVTQRVFQCNPTKVVEFLKVDNIDLDYRILDLNKDDVMFFISGYLLYKCLLKVFHCENCRLYALKQKVDMSYLNAALNTDSLNTESTDSSFYIFIQKLEKLFISHIKGSLTKKSVGNYLWVLLHRVKLYHPCANFPLSYLYTLFVRLRMFFVLKFANRELKKEECKEFIAKELCESFD